MAAPFDSAIKELDNAIAAARPLGSPIWHQQGGGGWLPSKTKHELFHDNLKQGARLDMFRGADCDGKENAAWEVWYDNMSHFKAILGNQQLSRNS